MGGELMLFKMRLVRSLPFLATVLSLASAMYVGGIGSCPTYGFCYR